MIDKADTDRCECCEQGKVIKRNEVLGFRQWTSRGYVSCNVQIPVWTCDRCGAKSWDEAAEGLIEQAVRQEHGKPS
jgi:hypothetical protein